MMISISLPLSAVVLFSVPAAVIYTTRMRKITQPRFVKRSRGYGTMNGFVEEMLSGQKTIQAYAYEKKTEEKFDRINTSAAEAYYDADYYGVTVDFLITPQSEETAKEVVSKEIASHSGANKAIVLALANVVVALIFTLIFVSNIINGHQGLSNVSFLFWALPACLFISLVAIRFLYGKQRIVSTILLSCFQWSILFGVILHFLFVAEPTMSLWYILVVGAPVQAILILFLFIKPVR
jgi:ABC-type multidrug transport system fused ATPase/permease subunit